jgi:flagellar basal body L-ring protein FlgH
MKRISLYSTAICILVFMLPVTCQAGSIWAKKSPASKSTYADDKAIQVGDVLTIVISEIHKVDNKVKATQSKTAKPITLRVFWMICLR